MVDTAGADVVYPLAVGNAKSLPQAIINATYGEPLNVGISFYPVQAAHLLLPQRIRGRHPTLVPIAIDQDHHVRICRAIATQRRYLVDKPGALLSKFLLSLEGPAKMSSSGDAPSIKL